MCLTPLFFQTPQEGNGLKLNKNSAAGKATNENIKSVGRTKVLESLQWFAVAGGFAYFSFEAQLQLASTALVLVVAGAAALVTGAFIGFVFNISRYAAQALGRVVQQVGGGALSKRAECIQVPNPIYSNDTNLKRVSDWLTETLLCVAFTHISDVRRHLSYGEVPISRCAPNAQRAGVCGVLPGALFRIKFLFWHLITVLIFSISSQM